MTNPNQRLRAKLHAQSAAEWSSAEAKERRQRLLDSPTADLLQDYLEAIEDHMADESDYLGSVCRDVRAEFDALTLDAPPENVAAAPGSLFALRQMILNLYLSEDVDTYCPPVHEAVAAARHAALEDVAQHEFALAVQHVRGPLDGLLHQHDPRAHIGGLARSLADLLARGNPDTAGEVLLLAQRQFLGHRYFFDARCVQVVRLGDSHAVWLLYDDHLGIARLGRYADDVAEDAVGDKTGRPDAHWVAVAREVFYHGSQSADLAPVVEITTAEQITQAKAFLGASKAQSEAQGGLAAVLWESLAEALNESAFLD